MKENFEEKTDLFLFFFQGRSEISQSPSYGTLYAMCFLKLLNWLALNNKLHENLWDTPRWISGICSCWWKMAAFLFSPASNQAMFTTLPCLASAQTQSDEATPTTLTSYLQQNNMKWKKNRLIVRWMSFLKRWSPREFTSHIEQKTAVYTWIYGWIHSFIIRITANICENDPDRIHGICILSQKG